VLILVAVQTGGIEPQKRPVQILSGIEKFRVPLDMIRLVAFSTFESAVLSLQPISGHGVIEIIDAVGPPDQLVIVSQMLHMAGDAFVVTLILMQAFAFRNSFIENFMTLEALRRQDLFAGLVATLAIFQSFQERMSLG